MGQGCRRSVTWGQQDDRGYYRSPMCPRSSVFFFCGALGRAVPTNYRGVRNQVRYQRSVASLYLIIAVVCVVRGRARESRSRGSRRRVGSPFSIPFVMRNCYFCLRLFASYYFSFFCRDAFLQVGCSRRNRGASPARSGRRRVYLTRAVERVSLRRTGNSSGTCRGYRRPIVLPTQILVRGSVLP